MIPGSAEEDEDPSSDSDVQMVEDEEPDSQRPGAWLSAAYRAYSEADRRERMVVPVELLYKWWCNGRPSGEECKDTFCKADLRHFRPSLARFRLYLKLRYQACPTW